MSTSLWNDFLTQDGPLMEKWAHYFPVYERHFAPWRNRTTTFWEIGVNTGASINMFQRYFGPLARIVGIDIRPECRSLNGKPGLHVRIGNQSDPKFLKEVIDEFGIPDIVLDDGSHVASDVWNTFQFVYPQMLKNGVYIVEDALAQYREETGGGPTHPDNFVNRSKVFVDQLNARPTYRTGVVRDPMLSGTASVCFYTGMVVFEKGEIYRNEWLRSGKYPDGTNIELLASRSTDYQMQLPMNTP